MKRVIAGGFAHESNTFTPSMTGWDDFIMRAGGELSEWIKSDPDSELQGAFTTLDELGYHVIPSVAAKGSVGGVIERGVFDAYVKRLQHYLDQVMDDVDGVLWVLHGSATVEEESDAQRAIVQILRNRFPNLPLVVTLDLHASVSDEVLALIDGVAAYHTAPHRDVFSTGVRGARMLDHFIRTGKTGRLVSVRIPLLLPGEFGQTDHAPMSAFMRQAERIAAESNALEVCILQGYPWADNANGTVSVLGCWDAGDVSGQAQRLLELAEDIWRSRADFFASIPVMPVAAAIREVERRSAEELLVLCDAGDNPTAGGTEDRVDVLRAAVECGASGLVFFPVFDEAFALACQGRVGEEVKAALGFSLDHGGSPFMLAAHVLNAGIDEESGPYAYVESSGNRVFVCGRRMAVRSPRALARAGIDPADRKQVLVVKSGYLFPEWQDFLTEQTPARNVLLGTPGATSLDLTTFRYNSLLSPVYPLTELHNPQAAVFLCGRDMETRRWSTELK